MLCVNIGVRYVLAMLLFICVLGCTSTKETEGARAGGSKESVDPVLPTTRKQADTFVQNADPPPGAAREFETDFLRSLVDFKEIISGGPPKDGIPAIDNPKFVSVNAADAWLQDGEMVFVIDGTRYGINRVRVYPVEIFIYHEIVNDVFGNVPIAVTYCPLCNSAVAFKRVSADGRTLRFGVSGRLRFSNMIMYDDRTESWWQQATGKAIVGELAQERLEIVPLLTISWKEARELYSDALVLSRDTGHQRPYGTNPYVGYDTLDAPFLLRNYQVDPNQNPFERVVVGQVNGKERAFLYSGLRENIVTHAVIGGQKVVLFWAPESVSPLDGDTTAGGRIVGSANIFVPKVERRNLTFTVHTGVISDKQTDSIWSPSGVAVSGELTGQQLEAVPSIQHFWFSYAAFSAE